MCLVKYSVCIAVRSCVFRAAYFNPSKTNPMNHYDNYIETKTILGLCDNYYTGVRDMMPLTDPEWDAKQEALSRLIQRKPKKGRGVGSNVMEKF